MRLIVEHRRLIVTVDIPPSVFISKTIIAGDVKKVRAECICHDSNVPHTKLASDCALRACNGYKIKMPYATNVLVIFNNYFVIDRATNFENLAFRACSFTCSSAGYIINFSN